MSLTFVSNVASEGKEEPLVMPSIFNEKEQTADYSGQGDVAKEAEKPLLAPKMFNEADNGK